VTTSRRRPRPRNQDERLGCSLCLRLDSGGTVSDNSGRHLGHCRAAGITFEGDESFGKGYGVEELDQDLIGTVGQVTVPITATRPGEVTLPVRGGTEAFTACSDEPIAKYARVVVVECLTGRTVSVTTLS
jgi:hypothetical protein